MRTLLVMIGFLAAAPLYGQERTWTIARDVFSTKAELVAVRGEIAYLKIGDKIEEYPLMRLSTRPISDTSRHFPCADSARTR